ncbi:MAG: 3'-5' exonuclease, partial [Actinomycetota bacterium]|nr:3'-5' exonuclease [Actinomycetota bacterium]
MAFTVPETIPALADSVTRGERKAFVALRDHLPDDYLVYYDIAVQGRHPDFVIVGPDLGLVVLEVKDWRLKSIAEVGAAGVRLLRPDGDLVVPNPIRQVRDYTLKTVDLLKQRPALRSGAGLRCGWGYGVLFPSLKSEDARTPSLFGPSLEEALEPGRVMTADDLAPEALLPRLRGLMPDWSKRLPPLDPAEVDEIRAVLYPEIRIGWGYSDADILRVMDREQERLARSLGDGHSLLRGVAGSGKTITLICRAQYLRATHPDWRVLVLCFNRVLADSLRDAIGGDAGIKVATFHSWCEGQLQHAGLPPPCPAGRGQEWDEYFIRVVPDLLLRAYDDGRLPQGTYQAILVDEGQDFADDWYRAFLRALDPITNSLFIALDSSQNIYRRKVSWRGIGVQIAGRTRTRVLRVNYRNTRAILSAAYRLIRELDRAEPSGDDTTDERVVPERALRSGPVPTVRRLAHREASRAFVLQWIRERLAQGVAPADVLVLGLVKRDMQGFAALLQRSGTAARMLGASSRRDGVRVSTIHGAKGLDADRVIVLDGHRLDARDEAEGRRLLYIAMTRARTE